MLPQERAGHRLKACLGGVLWFARELPLRGGRVSGYQDHRIVMSMAVAALMCEEPVEITSAESVQKSWPSFFADYQRIGGDVHVVD